MLCVITAVGALVAAVTPTGSGLGLIAPAILNDNHFNERSFELYLIVAGFPVLGLAVMTAIIGALGA